VPDNPSQIIILGAGPPHHGEAPTALIEARQGTTVLDWVLKALGSSPGCITFVAGYQAESVRARNPELHVVENPEWQNTGSGASLLAASFSTESDLIVCYSDILFRPQIIEKLKSFEAPVTIVWDSEWKRRYAGRSRDDMLGCEKVLVADGKVSRLGADIPVDWASGEFVGLVRFNAHATAQLAKLKQNLPESLKKVHVSGLLEYLRGQGMEIQAVDIAGDWAEVNEPVDIARFVLGTKAETLRRLRGMVSSAAIQDQVAFTISDWEKDRDAWLKLIRRKFSGLRVVVRSSARSEDSFASANAGAYSSVLDVEIDNGLEKAILHVIDSYHDPEPEDQVLVQPMVSDVVLSGVVFTRTLDRGSPYYVVNFDESGTTSGITSGESRDHKTLIVRRGAEQSAESRFESLLSALREIESLLGYDALDVEFAIDSKDRLYILQVRPITAGNARSPDTDKACLEALENARETWRRIAPLPPHLPGGGPVYGTMPDWNPAEIIGTCPGLLAESLYRFLVMDEVWAKQRMEYGYRDVRPQPLLVSFAGRVYVDVRASFSSFVPASVPDELAGKLVDFYLQWLKSHPHLHDKVEFDVVPTCFGPGFEKWETRLTELGGFKQSEVELLGNGLKQITLNAFTRSDLDLGKIELLQQRFQRIFAAENLHPLERARILLDDCRRLGTLPFAHLARSGFVAITLLRTAMGAGIISREAKDDFMASVRTIPHQMSKDALDTASGSIPWTGFVERYGHLRPGTYDITSPCYTNDPERFLRPLLKSAAQTMLTQEKPEAWEKEKRAFFESLGQIRLPSKPGLVENFLYQAIEGREYSKFVFSRNLCFALEDIASFGQELGLEREEMCHIALSEIMELRDSAMSRKVRSDKLRKSAETGRKLQQLAEKIMLPPLITGEQDFDTFVLASSMPNFIGSRKIIAECVDLTTSNDHQVAGRIVLIPQADPGYDWLFGKGVTALITMYGGANSHMAIRAAEFGMPAAIGVGEQLYNRLAGAKVIELDPGSQVLRVVR
jgi:glutamine kinase